MEKRKRPKEATGTTTRVSTGCGHLYVIVNTDGEGPIEIFAILGKAGGCAMCQNEALTRSISLGLKYGIPVEEFIDELKDLRCPNSSMFPENERVLSCADGISKVLTEVKNASRSNSTDKKTK